MSSRSRDSFTRGDAQDLEDFFGGFLTGEMGLTSVFGAMCEQLAARSTSTEAPRPPVQQDKGENRGGYLPTQVLQVRASSSGARRESTEAAPRALHAARRTQHIREVLRRLDTMHVRVLEARYTTRRPGWEQWLEEMGQLAPVAAWLVGEDRLREWGRRAAENVRGDWPKDRKREAKIERAAARDALREVHRQAAEALRDAQHAYGVASQELRRERRGQRVRRFREAISG